MKKNKNIQSNAFILKMNNNQPIKFILKDLSFAVIPKKFMNIYQNIFIKRILVKLIKLSNELEREPLQMFNN